MTGTNRERTQRGFRRAGAIAAAALCAAALAAGLYFGALREADGRGRDRRGNGLFSWTEEAWSDKEREQFLDVAKKSGIGEVYQEFSGEALKAGAPEGFVGELGRQGMRVYALFGTAEWSYEEDGASLCGRIRLTADYNRGRSREERISGIMADVEPYLLPEWEQGEEARAELMDAWLSGIRTAYACARENGLEFLVCIPVFFDTAADEVLRELAAEGCDGLAVMNYNREDEYGQIEREVELAESCGKDVICVYELQRAGDHGLTEKNTYAEEGPDALRAAAEKLRNAFVETNPEAALSFAFHYYEPLKEMLEERNTEG